MWSFEILPPSSRPFLRLFVLVQTVDLVSHMFRRSNDIVIVSRVISLRFELWTHAVSDMV
jgi:hypothetical protein